MGRRSSKPTTDDPGQKALNRVLEFFAECIVQTDGPRKGRPFQILPWEMDHIFRPVFGRVDANGFRIIRHLHLDIAKKNGKSGLCAGLAHYLAWGDGEPSARVAVCARDRYQAQVIFEDCKKMVELSPVLKKLCTPYKNMILGPNDSVIEVLSAEAANKHGPKFSAVLMDEIHAYPGYGREMHDILNGSVANRDNPLMVTMTTAGETAIHFWKELRDRVLEKIKKPESDPSFHGVLFTTDPEDDIFSEDTWKKANPSYGTILKKTFFQIESEKARNSKKDERLFRWLHLNQLVTDSVSWVSTDLLDGCRWSPELAGVGGDE